MLFRSEISNFALEGFGSFHNQKYWFHVPYLGIGAGAHSFWDYKRFNYEDFEDFFDNDIIKKFESVKMLTSEEIREEKIMLNTRTYAGVDMSLINVSKSVLDDLCDRNLIKIENGCIIPTLDGWMFINTVVLKLLGN